MARLEPVTSHGQTRARDKVIRLALVAGGQKGARTGYIRVQELGILGSQNWYIRTRLGYDGPRLVTSASQARMSTDGSDEDLSTSRSTLSFPIVGFHPFRHVL